MEILILPGATLTINVLQTQADGRVEFDAQLDGAAIQHTSRGAIMSYRLRTTDFVVTEPAESFAIWSGFEDRSVMTIETGEAVIETETDAFTVGENDGIFLLNGAMSSLPLGEPLNAARMVGMVDGCDAFVDSGDDRVLNIRSGAGLGFTNIGFIRNGDDMILMGVNEQGSWYRVQRFSGFGWVNFLGVVENCTDLTVFPNVFQEQNVELFAISERELTFLIPFYGDPSENLWFYR